MENVYRQLWEGYFELCDLGRNNLQQFGELVGSGPMDASNWFRPNTLLDYKGWYPQADEVLDAWTQIAAEWQLPAHKMFNWLPMVPGQAVDRSAEEIEALKTQIARNEEEAAKQKKQLATAKREATQHKKTTTEQDSKIKAQTKMLAEQEKDIAQREKAIADLENRLSVSEKKNTELENLIATQKAQIAGLKKNTATPAT